MDMHNDKLDHANVVAVFGAQDDAEEAVLQLRLAGFPDARVGYFARNLVGLVEDFVWKGHTVLGLVIGVIVGALLGWWAGWYALDTNATRLGPAFAPGDQGVYLTCILCGALLVGMTGALVGWGIPRGDAIHYGAEMEAGRYVVSVNAGDRTADAWDVIRFHGGHAPLPADAVTQVAPAPAV